jgi:hypothetical protein
MTVVVKTPIILEDAKDWVRWYQAVQTSAEAKEVSQLIDVNAAIRPTQTHRRVESGFTDVKPAAAAWAALTADEKEQFRFVTQRYRTKLNLYKERKKALNEILVFI